MLYAPSIFSKQVKSLQSMSFFSVKFLFSDINNPPSSKGGKLIGEGMKRMLNADDALCEPDDTGTTITVTRIDIPQEMLMHQARFLLNRIADTFNQKHDTNEFTIRVASEEDPYDFVFFRDLNQLD